MNLIQLHVPEKPVSAIPLFREGQGKTVSLRILKGHQLKDHSTAVPAFLICISGNAVFENENGVKAVLQSGDSVAIEPDLVHRVIANEDSLLLLLK